jgi:hypothetical protein
MYNGESVSPTEYGTPPEGTEEQCSKLCEGKTISDLRKIADYFNNEASKMEDTMRNDVTMEEFEKLKKDSSIEIPLMTKDESE